MNNDIEKIADMIVSHRQNVMLMQKGIKTEHEDVWQTARKILALMDGIKIEGKPQRNDTGYNDKNGKPLFDGDIVQFNPRNLNDGYAGKDETATIVYDPRLKTYIGKREGKAMNCAMDWIERHAEVKHNDYSDRFADRLESLQAPAEADLTEEDCEAAYAREAAAFEAWGVERRKDPAPLTEWERNQHRDDLRKAELLQAAADHREAYILANPEKYGLCKLADDQSVPKNKYPVTRHFGLPNYADAVAFNAYSEAQQVMLKAGFRRVEEKK